MMKRDADEKLSIFPFRELHQPLGGAKELVVRRTSVKVYIRKLEQDTERFLLPITLRGAAAEADVRRPGTVHARGEAAVG